MLHVCPCEEGDGAGGSVGHLGPQSAVLDRIGRGIARCIDAGVRSRHAARVVDRDEAVWSPAAETRDGRTFQSRHRHHALRMQLRPLGLDEQPPDLQNFGNRGGVDRDAGVLEQAGDRLARGLAEDRQRARLGRDHRHLEVFDPHAVGPLRCHQRELIDRKWIDGPLRQQEGHALRVAAFDVLHDALVGLVGLGVAEGPHVRVGRDLAGADGHQQCVEPDVCPPPVRTTRRVAIHGCKAVADALGAFVGCDAIQTVALRRAEGERLPHRRRPVDQIVVRSQ